MTVKLTAPKKRKAGNQVALVPGLRAGDVSVANYLGSLFPKQQTDDQIRSGIMDVLDPIVQRITGEAKTRTSNELGDLGRMTNAYVQQLGSYAPQVRADYAQAEADSGAQGAGLSEFLKSVGGSAGAEVASKLSAAGLPQQAIDEASAGAAGVANGAAGQTAAQGFTNQNYLTGLRKNNASYADLLPGFGRIEGIAKAGQLADDEQKALSDSLSPIYGAVPGLVQSARGQNADSRTARAQLIASFLGSSLDRNTQAAIAKAGLTKDYTAIDTSTQAKTGYVPDPVTGDLVPTTDNPNFPGGTNDQTKKENRQAALKNLASARESALEAARAIGLNAAKQTFKTTLEPVTPSIPSRQGRYKKRGGGFTNDPSQAETHEVKVPVTPPTFEQLVKLAMAQPEVTILARRFALKQNEVRDIVVQGLRAAGYQPTAPAKPASP